MKCRYIAVLCVLLSLASCRGKNREAARALSDAASGKKAHTWYCFDGGAIKAIDDVRRAPMQAQKPWTEAVRISSASSSLGGGTEAPAAYAVVNRLGMLVFTGDTFRLYTDAAVFSDRTAGNLVFQNDTPIFSLYKSAFFNTSLENNASGGVHQFLVLFDTASCVFYPLITCTALNLPAESEVTDFVWDGNVFVCSVKKSENEKTDFSYLSVQPKIPLLSLSPASAKSDLLISETDADAYRSQAAPVNIAYAPKRLQELASLVEEDTAFFVECRTAGGHSPRRYTNQMQNDDASPLSANALIADTYACLMFRDGTAYVSGALYGRHIVNGGKPVAFRLPKLPAGYAYTSFAVSGTTMYAAWEGSDFYKTGKSGFLSVDLEAILYGGVSPSER